MKLNAKIWCTMLLTIFGIKIYSQSENTKTDSIATTRPATKKEGSIGILKKNEIHFAVDLSATYIKGFGTFTSVAPSFNYQATQKLNMEFGTSVISGANSISPSSSNSTITPSSNQYVIFGHGNYLLTDKLMLTGSFYKSANSGSNQAMSNMMNYKGFDVGINYKLSKNIQVGAQIQFADGLNNLNNRGMSPFYYNPAFIGW